MLVCDIQKHTKETEFSIFITFDAVKQKRF